MFTGERELLQFKAQHCQVVELRPVADKLLDTLVHPLQDLLRRSVAVSVQGLEHPAGCVKLIEHICRFRNAIRISEQLVASAKLKFIVRILNVRKYAYSDIVLDLIEFKSSAFMIYRQFLMASIDKGQAAR